MCYLGKYFIEPKKSEILPFSHLKTIFPCYDAKCPVLAKPSLPFSQSLPCPFEILAEVLIQYTKILTI
jgi:hypothetical protein